MKRDLNFRYNLLAVLLIFLGFWRVLLMARIGNSALMTAFSILSPLVFVGLPLAVFPLVTAKMDKTSYVRAFSNSYRLKKTAPCNYFLGAAAGILGYFAYLYLYSAAVCLHEFATQKIALFPVASADGWYTLTVLMQGVFAGFATELMLRGGSRYRGVLGWIVPVLFGMMIGYDIDAWAGGFAVGLIGTALTNRSGSSFPAAIGGALFTTLGMTVGNFLDLPFTFRLVTSVESALYYAMMSAAFGVLAAGGCTLVCMAVRVGEKKAGQTLSKDGVITLCAAIGVFALLLTLFLLL